jgi:hypothetical protein
MDIAENIRAGTEKICIHLNNDITIKITVSIPIERNLKDSSFLLISSFDTLKYIIEDKDVNNNTSAPRINLKIFIYICILGSFSTLETTAIKYIKINNPIIDILNNLK